MKKIKILGENIIEKLVARFHGESVKNGIPALYECPKINSWQEISSKPLFFFCNWKENTLPKEAGASFLFYDEYNLNLVSVMEDSDVFSDAVGRNDKTWAKGDVLELFIQADGEKKYYEIHVAPNLATLELSIPDLEGFSSGKYPFESLFFDSEAEFGAGTICLPDFKGWWGLMSISLDKIGLEARADASANFAVCRYNYSRQTKELECSSSAPFTVFSFHRPFEWNKLVFK
jgi:hypothetical protein